ncbi:hypothetical protein CJ030_MR5G021750 [Morella rubra]|uniref:N-acetyltransferase domain-containing protein n=1 Tax=Morella rubra TaxID=262757 RepID=A0A6A1VJR9_9ROSI|nr:hypothetical protein CJ030_MR5G021750 [Morella rubra]
MAVLVANHHNIPRRVPCVEPLYGNKSPRQGRTYLMDCKRNWRNACNPSSEKHRQQRQSIKIKRGSVVHNSTSSAEEVDSRINAEGQFLCLVNDYGWRVRRLIAKADEMREVAKVQAEAFHVPVALFNDLFFGFFKAEVLSGLVYKLRNSAPNRYACLVAEPVTKGSDAHKPPLVGVVDVTVLRDKIVVDKLPVGTEEYLYVSGIAVLKSFRRQKIATVLLKACDVLSLLWGFEYLALRAYEDDLGARKLYASAGYQVVSGDPLWMTSWIGRKRRILMIKKVKSSSII